jgi:hypothetical protein
VHTGSRIATTRRGYQRGLSNVADRRVDYDGVYSSNDAAIFNSFYDESLASLPEPGTVGIVG